MQRGCDCFMRVRYQERRNLISARKFWQYGRNHRSGVCTGCDSHLSNLCHSGKAILRKAGRCQQELRSDTLFLPVKNLPYRPSTFPADPTFLAEVELVDHTTFIERQRCILNPILSNPSICLTRQYDTS